MSKRSNSEVDYDFLISKIRKLEEEIKHATCRELVSPEASSSSSSSSCSSREPSPNREELPVHQENLEPNPNQHDQIEIIDIVSDAPATSNDPDPVTTPDLSDILGVDPSITIEHGPDINKDVASRFCYISTTGLNKDTKKELIGKYLVPGNCVEIGAPVLNAEIKGVLAGDQVIKRDRAIEARQKQIAACITGLGRIISSQLEVPSANRDLIKNLMDVGRILCNVQHAESEARRSFALYSVKRELKDQLSNTKIDKYLFGSNLPETLKTAKAVSKSALDLKPEAQKKAKHTAATSKNLNWKTGTPARRQPPGPRQRHPPPAPQDRVPPPAPPPPRGNSSHTYSQRVKQPRRL